MHRTKRWRIKATRIGIALTAISLPFAGCRQIEGVYPASPSQMLSGFVHGGDTPVSGSFIQMYAAGTAGKASAAYPLLKTSAKTESDGFFSISGEYTCPSSEALVYLVATGGVPVSGGKQNDAISMMTLLGPCGQISASTNFEINEVTTVASVWALREYMTSPSLLGSLAGDAAFTEAAGVEQELVNLSTGISPGAVPAGFEVQVAKLNALADIVSACVNSSGGAAGDGTACGNLFASVPPLVGAQTPVDATGALLAIFQSPTVDSGRLYDLMPATVPFAPAVANPPIDWGLKLLALPAAPAISPAAGTYAAGQQVTMSTTTSGAAIHYTVDGSQPTANSPLYAVPLTLTGAETVNAISVEAGTKSAVASASYKVTTSHLVFMTQPASTTVSSALSPAPVVEIVDDLSGKVVTGAASPISLALSANPGHGSLAGSTIAVPVNGVAVFPGLSLTQPANGYTLEATSSNAPAVISSSFNVGEGGLSLSVSSAPVLVGTTATGTVTVTAPLVSAVKVNLASSSSSLVSVSPSSLTVAAGSTSSSFTYKATAAGSATITASATDFTSVSAPLVVAADPTISILLPNTAPSVGNALTGTITLSTPTSSATTFSLTSSAPAVVSIAPASLTVPAGASSATFTYSALTAGSAKLAIAAPLYTSGSVAVNSTRAVPTIPSTLFGLTVLDFGGLSPTVSFGTTRTWDSYPNVDWSDVNPSMGLFEFEWVDDFIAMAQARRNDVIYTLGRTPQWASSQPNAAGSYGPGECAPPSNMSYYDAYITALATHEKGNIKYYELWNEPQSTAMYCGTVQQMVTMAQHAARIIKSIDPNAQILSPGVTGGPGPAWLSSFLAAGGSAYVDGIAFHGYWSASAEDIAPVVSSYRSVMAANGVANLPMYDTEASWAAFGLVSDLPMTSQVGYIAKSYLLHWSEGVSRFVWYAYDGGSTWGGMLTSTGAETPAAASYKQVYRWMVGASMSTPCAQAANGVYTCGLTTSQRLFGTGGLDSE